MISNTGKKVSVEYLKFCVFRFKSRNTMITLDDNHRWLFALRQDFINHTDYSFV